MKRTICLLLAVTGILMLFAGCSKSVGGTYVLSKITADGYLIAPKDLSMNISFTLESDGTGKAQYNSTELEITWSRDGKSISLIGLEEDKVLELTVSGGDLILHDDGTVMVFERQEDED